MRLSDHRVRFSSDVAKLIDLAWQRHDIELALHEVARTPYQQAEYVRTGKSRTMNSDHLKGLAVDFVFYVRSGLHGSLRPVWAAGTVQEVGELWYQLDPDYNYWGWAEWGFDTPHFGRKTSKGQNQGTREMFGDVEWGGPIA